MPRAASSANGEFVEAKGDSSESAAGELIATRSNSRTGTTRLALSATKAEVEGYITAFTNGLTFSVSGIPVHEQRALTTGGTVGDSAPRCGSRVKLDAAGVLVARVEVQVRDR